MEESEERTDELDEWMEDEEKQSDSEGAVTGTLVVEYQLFDQVQ